MKLNRVFFANASLALVLLYALMTVVFVYIFKMPAIGLTYILAAVFIGFFCTLIFSPPGRASLELVLLIAILISCGFSVFAQSLLQKEYFDYLGRSTHVFAQSVFYQNTLWLFSGMAVARAGYGSNNYIAWAIVGIVASLVWPNLGDGFLVSYADIAEEGFEGVNHLLVAEMILFLSFFAYSLSSGLSRLVLILCIGALVFSSGGRFSFYFGIVSFFVYEFLYGSNKKYFYGLVGCLIVAVLLAAFVPAFENEAVQRMLFSGGVSDDLSYAERNEYLIGGLLALPEQIFFGDPGWLVRTHGSAGTYIHNVLSAWQFYGLIAFLLIIFFIYRLTIRLIRIKRKFVEPVEIFGALCVVYGFAGILASKFIGFSFFWFAAGFWAFRLDSLRLSIKQNRVL